MRRYSLGSHVLVENIINEFNNSENGKTMYSISGLLIDGQYRFSAVVEYYELDSHERLNLNEIEEEIEGSRKLALELEIPLFIVTYTSNEDKMRIYDYFNKTQDTKSIIKPQNDDCEFVKWWKQYKGTYQSKPFYKPEYTQWKINNILNEGKTRWGGDVDGIVIDEINQNIYCVVEFRKSTNELVENYDPARYFKGTQSRCGDYYTWKPLTTLKDELNVPLYLVTLSQSDKNVYGLTEVEGIDRESLNYVNNVQPNNNIYNSIELLCQNI